jgi:hypothetical protein
MTVSTRKPTPLASIVPLAVWPVGNVCTKGRKSPCLEPPRVWSSEGADFLGSSGCLGSNLARRIITEYSRKGDLVVDPACTGTSVLAAAAQLGRRAHGIAPDRRCAGGIEKDVARLLTEYRRRLIQVTATTVRKVKNASSQITGSADLVCVSPDGHRSDPRLDGEAWETSTILGNSLAWLRPGGLLVVVLESGPGGEGLAEDMGLCVAAARRIGFVYLQHVVAIGAPLSDGALVADLSLAQRTALHGDLKAVEPVHLHVHHDVAVFQKPTNPEVAHAS